MEAGGMRGQEFLLEDMREGHCLLGEGRGVGISWGAHDLQGPPVCRYQGLQAHFFPVNGTVIASPLQGGCEGPLGEPTVCPDCCPGQRLLCRWLSSLLPLT